MQRNQTTNRWQADRDKYACSRKPAALLVTTGYRGRDYALDLEVIRIGPGEREELAGHRKSGPSVPAGHDANVGRDPANSGNELQLMGPDTGQLRTMVPFLGGEFDGVLERKGGAVRRRQGRCAKRRTESKRQPVYHKSRFHFLFHPVQRQ